MPILPNFEVGNGAEKNPDVENIDFDRVFRKSKFTGVFIGNGLQTDFENSIIWIFFI